MSLQLSAQVNGSVSLLFGSGAIPSTARVVGGLSFDEFSRIYAASSGAVAHVLGGVPVDSNGRVLSGSGAISNYVNGLPVSSNGYLAGGGVAITNWSGGLPFDRDGNLVAWNPQVLFAGGEVGFLNTLALDTLFTDTAGTTPVTTIGDTIALGIDQSGNSNDMVQATAAARPVYGRMPVSGVRNLVSNNILTGAVVGNPGTLPTEWNVAGSSWVNTEVVALGEIGGVPYIDLRIYGTPTNTSGVFIQTMASPLSFGVGDTFSLSVYSALLTGDVSNISNIVLRTGSDSPSAILPLAPDISRATQTGVTATANPRLNLRFNANVDAIGVPQDFTLRIMGLQLEHGSDVTDLQLVDGPYNVTQSGTPSVPIAYMDTSDDNFSWTLPAGTYYLFIAGEKGCYFDTVEHAGGEFTVGPTSWTGGPDGAITTLIGQRHVIMPVIRDEAFTQFEREQLVAYAMAKGAPGVWEGTELVSNPGDPFTDTIGWNGINDGALSVVGGNLTVTYGSNTGGSASSVLSDTFTSGELALIQVEHPARTTPGNCQVRLTPGFEYVQSLPAPPSGAYAVHRVVTGASNLTVGFGGGAPGGTSSWGAMSVQKLTLNTDPYP